MDGDDDQMGTGMRFELFAASLRADATDTLAFLEALATKLGGALPHRTEIKRGGGLFSHTHHIQHILVRLGEWEYALEAGADGSLATSRTHAVRGIALKSEPLSLDEWISELSSELEELARTSQQDEAALRRLLS